eukprot:746454-Hanusia_phi.AAC.2
MLAGRWKLAAPSCRAAKGQRAGHEVNSWRNIRRRDTGRNVPSRSFRSSSCCCSEDTRPGHTLSDKMFRQNPATGDWVVYSMARANRPKQTVSFLAKQYAKDSPTYEISCPFCMGNEHMTPKAILEYKSHHDPNAWSLRVILNKYPAVTPLTCLNATKDNHHHIFSDGRVTNNEMPAVGHHEVCIENPQHNYIIATGNRNSLNFMVKAWMERNVEL